LTTWDELTGKRDEPTSVAVTVPDALRRFFRLLLVSEGIWTVLAIAICLQNYSSMTQRGEAIIYGEIILFPLIRCWTHGLIGLPLFLASRRFTWSVLGPLRFVAFHLVAFSLWVVAFVSLRDLTLHTIGPVTTPPATFATLFKSMTQIFLADTVWTYTATVIAAHASAWHRTAKRKTLLESELRAELAQSQLDILRLQLQPHFLFNTLNGISALMQTDVRAARTAIMQFSDLLRTALAQSERKEVPLRDELAFVQLYLELQSLRLGERLTFAVRVDEALLDLFVPTMLLQPVVENAVRHGIERRAEPGHVEVEVSTEGDAMRMAVTNDGGAGDRRPGSGIGLRNLRARLAVLYGNDSSLQLVVLPEQRVRVTVVLPLLTGERTA
jgi:hypothetical protein